MVSIKQGKREAAAEMDPGPAWRAYRADDIDWKHIRPGLSMKQLDAGWRHAELGFNKFLALVGKDYDNPRHRHPFEQVRVNISGAAKYGIGMMQREGEIGYFPEGVAYGPTTSVDEQVMTLTIQFPGPQRIPYLSPEEQRDAKAAIEARGEAMPTGPSAPYDALVSETLGHTLEIGEGRSDTHVIFRDTHPWEKYREGIRIKHLGYFNEVGPNFKLLELEPGAELSGAAKDWFEIREILGGSVKADGEEYPSISGFYLNAGRERPIMKAGDAGAKILVIQIARSAERPVPFAEI